MNTTQKTNDGVTRTLLITWDESRCSGMVSSSCSTSDTRRVTVATNPVIHHGRKNWIEITTSVHIYDHFVTQVFVTVNQVMVATVKLSK
jgi:hypothetical protein